MTKDVSMRLHRIFNVIVAAFVGLCGICFGVACLYIYFEKGEYSREIVAEVFSYIAVPVYISVVHVIAGLIYELVSPLKRKKEKPERDRRFLLSRLSGKKNFSECDKASVNAVIKVRKQRAALNILRIALACASAAVFLFFALNIENFPKTEINAAMIKAMTWLCPCLFVSGGYSVFYAFFEKRSMDKEAELLKRLPDARGEAPFEGKESRARAVILTAVRIAVAAVAVAAIVYGALEGGFADVMTKAVNICTECIGLG